MNRCEPPQAFSKKRAKRNLRVRVGAPDGAAVSGKVCSRAVNYTKALLAPQRASRSAAALACSSPPAGAKRWIERLDRPGLNLSEQVLHVYPVQNGSARHLAEKVGHINIARGM